MRKLLVIISIFLMIFLPKNILAKKITCNNGLYSVTLELMKEKINIDGTTIIAINSDYEYKVNYKIIDNTIVSINDDGVVKGLKEGNTKINAEVNFLESETICQVNLPIEVVSNDSSLKLLNIEEFDISEMFQPEIFEYTVQLPYNIEKINIIAIPNNETTKIIGSGRRYLNEGNNIYDIIVTASDGTTSTYKIIVERAEASDDSSLKSLIVAGYILEPKFNKDVYEYNLSIPNNVETITIKAEPTYELAKIMGIGTFNIASGDNTYFINVLAENSTNSTYEIHIHKTHGSGKLKSLEIAEQKLEEDFDSERFIYHTTVGSKINSLEIKAEGYDNEEIEIINNEELVTGENEIFIKVINQDKTTTTYKIVANKLDNIEEQKREKNNRLLKILFIMFIIAIIFMTVSIVIFIKRNLKRKKKKKK